MRKLRKLFNRKEEQLKVPPILFVRYLSYDEVSNLANEVIKRFNKKWLKNDDDIAIYQYINDIMLILASFKQNKKR